MISNKTYDILKWIALVGLPALSTFYAVIAELWNLPYGTQICGTISAIGTLIGSLLQVSSTMYHAKNNS